VNNDERSPRWPAGQLSSPQVNSQQGGIMSTDAVPPGSPPDLGYELRWRDRLSSHLLLFTAAAGLAIVAALFVAELRFERFVVEQAAEESDLMAQTVANAIYRAMLLDRREDAYRILEDVGRQPGVDRIRLLDHGGRVAFSTDAAETGRTLDPRGPQCVVCHFAGAARPAGLDGRRRIEAAGEQRVLQLVAPIANQPACAAAGCHVHPNAARLLGLIAVDRSLAVADARLASFRWTSLGAAALVAAGLGFAFWWLTRRRLVEPVAALVAATRRVALQDLDQPAAPTFGGELGLLATNFGEMVRSLRSARAELDALNRDLERKVETRTRALVETREQLARGETLAALGRLSAAVGHRLGSPLSGILTIARGGARSLEAGPLSDEQRARLLHDLRLVEREAERAGEVVVRLVDFSHDHPFSAQPVGIDAVVDEALELAAGEARLQGVSVRRSSTPTSPVLADRGLVRQAVLDTLLLACRAMPDGGQLTVETGPAAAGREVEIAVTDTGPALPPDRLARVFEPDFSATAGAGLGLAQAHAIAFRHGGRLLVTSEPGRGTRVAIRLPAPAPAEEGAGR
jgi:two-component system NtrC family sensor kinase